MSLYSLSGALYNLLGLCIILWGFVCATRFLEEKLKILHPQLPHNFHSTTLKSSQEFGQHRTHKQHAHTYMSSFFLLTIWYEITRPLTSRRNRCVARHCATTTVAQLHHRSICSTQWLPPCPRRNKWSDRHRWKTRSCCCCPWTSKRSSPSGLAAPSTWRLRAKPQPSLGNEPDDPLQSSIPSRPPWASQLVHP